ncbi:hypothetical protein BDP27DRAFT_1420756 [Rhodocollybia butyracea]|uniref:Uncharacterized protein n=1 Tax=Rhodocollybia butyracea TaxID=206335 RepID=A0A9P5U943_9AGAR|nr:hypothetical protein BDP27DRAFT_1420756 [Rhodocollybia butyracea]
MSAFISVISAISSIITVVNAFQDLFPYGSKNQISLQDFAGLLRQENVRFFTEVEAARLQSTRLSFYDVWLPAISKRTTITPGDLNLPTGEFYHVYPQLRDAIRDVHMRVETLAAVFRANTTALHVDDFLRGLFLLMELYGLLLHMHAVWATLRRVEVGAATFDDPRLNVETRYAITYTSSAQAFVREMLDLVILVLGRDRRTTTSIRFNDTYSPLGNPPFRYNLLRLPNSYRRDTLSDDNASSWISQARNGHINSVRALYDTVTQDGPKFLGEMDKLMSMLDARLVRQGGVRGLNKLHGVDDVYNSEKEEKEALLEISKDGDEEAT